MSYDIARLRELHDVKARTGDGRDIAAWQTALRAAGSEMLDDLERISVLYEKAKAKVNEQSDELEHLRECQAGMSATLEEYQAEILASRAHDTEKCECFCGAPSSHESGWCGHCGKEGAARVARLRRDYVDVADALLPSSDGPADVIAEARRLRKLKAAALAFHRGPFLDDDERDDPEPRMKEWLALEACIAEARAPAPAPAPGRCASAILRCARDWNASGQTLEAWLAHAELRHGQAEAVAAIRANGKETP